MIESSPSSSGASEARLELAVAAAAAERANKPRWIIALGIASLAASVVFLLVALQGRSTALSKVATERAYTARILDLKQGLEKESAKLAARGTAPNNHMAGDLENLAHAMEITLAGPITDPLETPISGMQRHTYVARANNQDPERILRWLVATQTTPTFSGLEIMQMSLRPGAATAENTPGWNVSVTFGRWEKK